MIGLLICVGAVTLIGLGLGYLEVIMRILRKCGCGRILYLCRSEHAEEEEEEAPDVAPKPFLNMPPPVLPVNFKEMPVQACLREIKVQMTAMEKMLNQAKNKASTALTTLENSL
jgi:hypothetical protein